MGPLCFAHKPIPYKDSHCSCLSNIKESIMISLHSTHGIPRTTEHPPHTHNASPHYWTSPTLLRDASPHDSWYLPALLNIPHTNSHPPHYCTHVVWGEYRHQVKDDFPLWQTYFSDLFHRFQPQKSDDIYLLSYLSGLLAVTCQWSKKRKMD